MATAFHPRDYVALFRRNPNMRRLWIAGVVSMTADWFHRIAIHTLLFVFFTEAARDGRVPPGSVEALVLLWTTFAFMAQMTPPFLFAPLLGSMIDRWPRRTIMIASDAARAVLAVGFILFDDIGMLWLMFALEIPLSLGAGFFDNSQKAILPDLVEKEDLVAANGLIQSTWGITAAFGAVAGGVVIKTLGPDVAFVLNGLTFLFSMACVMRLRVVESHLPEVARRRAERLAARRDGRLPAPPADDEGFLAGVAYIVRRRTLLALVSAKPGWSLTGGMILTLHTLMGASVFANWGNPALGIGMLHGARGVGSILGSLVAPYVYPWFRARPLRVMAIIFVIYGLDYGLVARAGHVMTAAALLVLGTTLSAQLWIMPAIILQQTLPTTIRGRVFSLDQGLSLVTMGLSGLAAYLLREHVGIGARDIALVAGLGLLGVGLVYAVAALTMTIDLDELSREAEERDAAMLRAAARATTHDTAELAAARAVEAQATASERADAIAPFGPSIEPELATVALADCVSSAAAAPTPDDDAPRA